MCLVCPFQRRDVFAQCPGSRRVLDQIRDLEAVEHEEIFLIPQHALLDKESGKLSQFVEPYRVEPVLHPEQVVLGVLVDGPDVVVGVSKRLFVLRRLDEPLILVNQPLPGIGNGRERPLNLLSLIQTLEVALQVAEGHIRFIDPAPFMVEPATAAGDIQPGVPDSVPLLHPHPASIGLPEALHFARRGAVALEHLSYFGFGMSQSG